MRIGIDADVVAEVGEAPAGAVPMLNHFALGRTDSEKPSQTTRRDGE
jgi:hypothetical protein